MSTRIWLMRHAESATPNVFHGAESDIGLSERGRDLVQTEAPGLARLGAKVVVSSGMKRALATATPIATAGKLPLYIEPDLHERRVGILSGMPTQPEGPLWLETVRRWTAGELEYTTAGAESFADIRRRVLPVWERLTQEHADGSAFIVAHGVVIKVLILSILPGWSPAVWRKLGPIPYLGITELLRTGEHWVAVYLNKTLKGLPKNA